jgi:hypothetical protein
METMAICLHLDPNLEFVIGEVILGKVLNLNYKHAKFLFFTLVGPINFTKITLILESIIFATTLNASIHDVED